MVETAKLPNEKKSLHLAIFLGAAIVLLIGGMWRGGTAEEPAQDGGITAIESLQRQLSGLQSVLSQNELQSIRQTMIDVSRESARVVVAISPVEAGPLRQIAVYGSNRGALDETPTGPALTPALSGILIDEEGHILTSAAVVELGTEFQVASSTSRYIADLKAIDRNSYLALLKLRDLPAAPATLNFDPARNLQPGEWVIRQGRVPSSGESRSVGMLESVRTTSSGTTVGVLSGQSDLAMDGAAVVDISGKVVGIQITPPESSPIVIPAASALAIAQSLKNQRTAAAQSWAGFQLQDLGDDLKEHLSSSYGVFVAGVDAGSPAAKAGLRRADVIQKFDGAEVTSAAGLLEFINASPAGTRFELTIRRNSREQTVRLVTEAAPSATALSQPSDESKLFLRLTASSGGAGLVIGEVNPPALANRLGLKNGDLIQSVDLNRVGTAAQFSALQRAIPQGRSQLWEIRRGERTFFVAIKQPVELL